MNNQIPERATPEEIKRARELYCNRGYDGDDIEIDDDALVSRPEDANEGGVWVQAWVWVTRPYGEEESE